MSGHDAIVVGAGIVGAACARELARAGQVVYLGGPLSLLLGAYAMSTCPDVMTPEGATNFEIYYVLEGNGQIELDGMRFDVSPGTSVLIKPGCRHRAIGKMKILNVPIPAFNPDDEWFDD